MAEGPTGPVAPARPLDPAHAGDARLLEAMARGRALATARLAATFHGLDLASWSSRTGDVTPTRATTTSGSLRRLDVAGAVDRLLAEVAVVADGDDPTTSRITVARDGIDEDLLPQPPLVVRRDGAAGWFADRAELDRHLAARGSCKLRGLDVEDPVLAALAEDVERVMGTRTNLLAYVAGAGAAGWGAHYDRHDGVVVQISGSKRWRLFEPVERRPLRPWTPYEVSGHLADEVVLVPGDVLVVPRGWGHEVVGTEEPSLHLTIPVLRPTGATVISHGAGTAAVAPALRRDLAVGGSVGVADLMASVAGPEAVAEAVSTWRAAIPLRRPLPLEHQSNGEIRLAAAGGAHRDPSGGYRVAGIHIPDEPSVVAVLAELLDGEPHERTSLDAIEGGAEGLAMLAAAGLLPAGAVAAS